MAVEMVATMDVATVEQLAVEKVAGLVVLRAVLMVAW